MGSLEDSFSIKKVSELDLSGVASEAIGWCNELNSRGSKTSDCKIVIVGGSEKDASALYEEIQTQNQEVLIRLEKTGYDGNGSNEYCVELDKLKLKN